MYSTEQNKILDISSVYFNNIPMFACVCSQRNRSGEFTQILVQMEYDSNEFPKTNSTSNFNSKLAFMSVLSR